MKKHPKSYSKKILLGLLTWGIIFNIIPTVRAQSSHSSLSDTIPSEWQFRPPSRLGIPVGREGGATRAVETILFFESDENWDDPNLAKPQSIGQPRDRISAPIIPQKTDNFCAEESLVILIPESGKNLTASANPTFYWYLPPNNAAAVEFSLGDGTTQIYNVRYLLTGSSNSGKIMGLRLPSFGKFSGLKTGQEYVWEVKLICDLNQPRTEAQARGIIERVSLPYEIRNNLANASTEESLGIYIDANLWHETINTMIRLQRENPNNPEVEAAWEKLMESVQLSVQSPVTSFF
jgi:hypothetical protein